MLRVLRVEPKSFSSLRRASTYKQAKSLRKYPVGGQIHGFNITDAVPVPELSLTAVTLEHERTKAKHLHIDRDDLNNVFSIAFKTNPPNKTGVPHILEHTTLCGSYKYPVRDPFFKMLNRSLSNFMNAMTGHDYTFFPFATTNEKDFENLRNVYLDATLNPLLKEQDFYQEGWRLENGTTDDINSPLTFKGVVYNEMKGQVSNSSYLYWIKFQESIYPSLNNSGGDPSDITNLTYEDLLDFHAKCYHPSNARTFTYGSLPLKDTLQHLDTEYSVFGKRTIKNIIRQPLELKESQTVVINGPVDSMIPADKQLKASLTWKCGSPSDVYETFALKILSNLLTDGHSSPLYQRLIESGLGDDFSVNTGLESLTAVNLFSVGLQGLDSIEVLEEKVNEVLVEYSKTGFPDSKIQAIIQQLELSIKDHKSDFGLNLLSSIVPGWVNNVDPLETLAWDDIIDQFKNDYKKGGFFEKLITKYLIDKPVFRFVMEPAENFEDEVKAEEAQRLEKKIKNLNDADKEIIFKRGQDLAKIQSEVEDLSSLPSLKVSDISRSSIQHPVSVSNVNNSQLQKRITDTNGLTYLRASRDVDIPFELYPYVSLFTDALTNLGTETQSMAEIEDYIKLYTGGVSSSVGVHSSPKDTSARLSFNFSGVALNQNASHIYEVWEKLLLGTNFNNKDKLSTLIRILSSNNTGSVAESGHSFARGFASSSISTSKAISEKVNGISQLEFLNKLNSWIQDDELFQKNIIDKLNELKGYLINSNDLRFSLVSDPDSVAQNEKYISSFLTKLPSCQSKILHPASGFPITNGDKTFIKFPFQVGYSSTVFKGVPYEHEDGAKLQVLSNLLTYKHLHREIREKGGAYGGGATYSALDGLFSYYSYRDPNALRSIDTFKKAGEFGATNEWKDRDIEEAKLTIFQSLDAPISVKAEGQILFKDGVTDHMRQMRRQQLLDVDEYDVKEVAEKYLINQASSSAIVGAAELKEEDWKVVDLAL